MSEKLWQQPIQETLRPDVTPEMGFQSFEMLDGSAEARTQQEQAFLAGETLRPALEYPLINDIVLNSGIRRLSEIGKLSSQIEESDFSDAVWNSAGYRAAEMYWLKQAKQLAQVRHNPNSEAFRIAAERYQELNEQLYGKPDAELTANVIGEVFAQAADKQLDETGQAIFNQLKYGTKITVAGKTTNVRGLGGLQHGRLPEIGDTLDMLREVLEEDFSAAHEIVETYWNDVIAPRSQAGDTEPAFVINDMVNVFNQLRDRLDPDNTANISIVIKEGATAMAWDTPTMSVRVGSKRSAINSKSEMVGHLIHELGVHGGRAIHGLKTDMPVLGTGLFTEALAGEYSDYLTFEEGFASLTNMAVNDEEIQWKGLHTSHYLSLALAYMGADFRESFEVLWRARVMLAAPDGMPLTDEIIAKERKAAYTSMVRTRRGTPTEVAHERPLTFNKDLAYLQGKIIGLQFLQTTVNDKTAIRQALRGKFDPTNTAQKRLADKYL